METLKQPNLTLKGTRKIKTKPKVCWEKEIINTRVEKQTLKKQYKRSMKPRAAYLTR